MKVIRKYQKKQFSLYRSNLSSHPSGIYNANSTIINSYFKGEIEAEYSAGIVGQAGTIGNTYSFVTITNCIVDGTISGYVSSGICGLQSGSTETNFVISNCVHKGDITNSASSGIIADDCNGITINNCIHNGDVIAYASGIVSTRASNIIINNSYCVGHLGYNSSGICGNSSTSTAVVNYCYATSKNKYAYLVGNINNGITTITDSYGFTTETNVLPLLNIKGSLGNLPTSIWYLKKRSYPILKVFTQSPFKNYRNYDDIPNF